MILLLLFMLTAMDGTGDNLDAVIAVVDAAKDAVFGDNDDGGNDDE